MLSLLVYSSPRNAPTLCLRSRHALFISHTHSECVSPLTTAVWQSYFTLTDYRFRSHVLQVHREGDVYDRQLFEKVLRGESVDLQQYLADQQSSAASEKEALGTHEEDAVSDSDDGDDRLWHSAVDDKGRTYWWHEETRETRWTRPRRARRRRPQQQ